MDYHNSNCFELYFLGTTGSCALMNRSKKSSNTLSLLVRAGEHNLILDAGTGICNLKPEMLNGKNINLLLSHYHVDHIEGLLFWDFIFNPEYQIDIYGHCFEGNGVKEILTSYFKPPFYPVGIESFQADLSFVTITNPTTIRFGTDVEIATLPLSHPNGCTGYRINYGGKSICYLTDIEIALQNDIEALYDFAKDTDALIFDTFFDMNEYVEGWGHSTWQQAAHFAHSVNADMLITYHHNFRMSDEKKADFVNQAKQIHANTIFSDEGTFIKLI